MDPVTDVAVPPLNPWRTMWFSPRQTIRQIIASDVQPGWFLVLALAAVGTALQSLEADEMGNISASHSMMPVLIGVTQLLFGVFVGPILMAIVGGWLGGEADPSDLRHAVVWSHVPVAAGALLWIPIFLTLGGRAFGADTDPFVGLEWIGALLLIGVGISALWTVPLVIGGIAAAQRFSIAKAALTYAIVLVPTFLFWTIS